MQLNNLLVKLLVSVALATGLGACDDGPEVVGIVGGFRPSDNEDQPVVGGEELNLYGPPTGDEELADLGIDFFDDGISADAGGLLDADGYEDDEDIELVPLWPNSGTNTVVSSAEESGPTSESVEDGQDEEETKKAQDVEETKKTQDGEDTKKADEVEQPEQAEEPKEVEWTEPKNEMTLVRFFNGRYYQSQYNRINQRLIEEVNSTDIDTNMQVLSNWYENEKQRNLGIFNRATVEALDQILRLTLVNTRYHCNRDTYAILVKNDRATSGRTHVPPSKLKPLRRVEALVHKISMRHALECHNVYPEEYARILETGIQRKDRIAVEFYLDALIGDPYAITSPINAVKGRKAAMLAYNSILARSTHDPNRRFLGLVVDEDKGKMVINGEGVRALVHEYLVKPCREFHKALGPDVFIPARYDIEMLEKTDRYQAAEDERVAEFMHGWLQYRLCELLIKRDEWPLTKSLIKYVKEMSKRK